MDHELVRRFHGYKGQKLVTHRYCVNNTHSVYFLYLSLFLSSLPWRSGP